MRCRQSLRGLSALLRRPCPGDPSINKRVLTGIAGITPTARYIHNMASYYSSHTSRSVPPIHADLAWPTNSSPSPLAPPLPPNCLVYQRRHFPTLLETTSCCLEHTMYVKEQRARNWLLAPESRLTLSVSPPIRSCMM